ncbi:MAG: beta-ketoacyl-[acyl-carrier-protein] synthase family protein [Bacteroidales bacterium]|nr:beta-ketoacyl-[acyl-carrier-protein] synthase family protein [Bacteroidales bacterium]
MLFYLKKVLQKVYITGAGIVSAAGFNTGENLASLRSSSSGIGRISFIDTIHADDIPVAEVKASNDSLREMAGISKKQHLSRTSLISLIAAREAIESAGIENTGEFPTGLISASTVGGMDNTEKFFKRFMHNNAAGRLRYVINHDVGDHTEKIAEAFGIRDHVSTISTACSSSANAILLAARMISNGFLGRVIAGGTDALTLFTINGFNSLMILDKRGCRPFDNDRNGLTLGEGAAYLVLESEEIVSATGKKPAGMITGYGNACDAYHQTASSPEGEGAVISMTRALEKAGIGPESIDYINAHGTGTKNNDLSEGKAVERVFGQRVPPVSSTKSLTGHTLGAAGAIEAVFSLLAIQNNSIWPNKELSAKMTELDFEPVSSLITGVTLKNVLSNSFGFGGNNTSLIFSKC